MNNKYIFAIIIAFLPSTFLMFGQTGPSQTGQNSLDIFVGSGKNQLIIAEIAPDVNQISVSSENLSLLDVIKVDFSSGKSFALIEVEEKGTIGNVDLLIDIDNGSTMEKRVLTINIVSYDNQGLNFEIHDIVFWQETIPLEGIPVFDTVIQTGQGPYQFLNYDNIPITVNLDCNSPVCTGHDFYTAFYRGYVIPPVDGTYHFYFQSNDRGALWMSNNENFTSAQMIAGATNNHGEAGTNVGNNTRKSGPRELIGGKVYAIYATQWIIHSTIGGISWDGPGIVKEFIPGEYMMPIYDVVKPSIPGNLKLDWKATTSIHVSWDPSTDNYKIAGYNLYLNGIRYNDENIQTTSLRVDDLTENTRYDFVVTSVDRAGNESFVSNILTVETFDADNEPPTPPLTLEVLKATGLALHLKWAGAVDNETQVLAYNLYVDGELFNTMDFIYDDNIIITNLLPNSQYNITIETIDAGFNISEKSEVFIVSTVDFDPMDEGLGQKRGRLVVKNRNISWNQGFGLNVPYENGNYPNETIVRGVVEEFGAGAVRWGAITANSRSFAGSTGTSPSHNNTYARVMNHANQIGAFFAITVGVNNNVDYMQEPNTFLRLMEYLNGPADSEGGARRVAEGFTDPLLPNSPGVLLEFGNEVWGANAHDAPIGANYDVYAKWVRDMSDIVRSSPYYDSEKIIMVSSGRYPHPASSWGVNTRVLTGDRGHVENLGVSGYLGGNLNYDPEIPAGESELDYYKNGIAMARNNMDGFVLTMKEMLTLTGTLKTFYLYESNMTTSAYNGRFGQAIVMTDYLASGMLYGSIVPSIFHLTGGQWRITRPGENYKRLPLFETGKYFNRFCKGHILETEFITNNIISNSSDQKIDWEPVGAYAYNHGENFSILLINRDFTKPYTVQIELPTDIAFNSNAKIYTLWEDDFSSYETNIDSVDVTLTNGMLVNVPKHGMVIIAAQGTDPQYTQLPHGYYERDRPEYLTVTTNGDGHISTSQANLIITSVVTPENAFSTSVIYEILENTTKYTLITVLSGNRLRISGSGISGDDGYVTVKVYAADNHDLSETLTVNITNQGPVSVDDLSVGGNKLFHPNPANDRIQLSKSIPAASVVELFDVTGRKVMKHNVNDGFELKIADLQTGIFLVRITTPDGKILHGKLNKIKN